MGANLCSLRQPSSERRRRIISSSSDHEKVNHGSSSIINFMKPDCLKTEKINKKKRKHYSPEKKITKAKKLTLEEWLMASPAGPKPECFLGGELHVFKNFSKRVHPTSKRVHADVISGPRDSLTLERLVKVDEGVEEDKWEVPSSIMPKSGKLKKKVSFKLPEEADTILFYSPADEEAV